MAESACGHIEQLPSGSYRVSVYSGTDPLTGRELRHRETAQTKHHAQILLGKLLDQADAGRRPDSRVLVRDGPVSFGQRFPNWRLDSGSAHPHRSYTLPRPDKAIIFTSPKVVR